MVNIRRTLADAMAERVLSRETGFRLESIAKELPYRERGFGRALRLAADLGLPSDELATFKAWLPTGRFDQKRDDAHQMLRAMRHHLTRADQTPEARFHFERTSLWDRTDCAENLCAPLTDVGVGQTSGSGA